ncbi:hypothetical protein LTR56_002684 [Elasticomyces elasticus]|nr:hypothetical protein LTR22_014900 [Elasticomyces elasticus]KAK3657168.1 hypothetical protein LTR56_002684 [Elasticomyces elasticus]KAK4914359.1 hypothetical protein LTR49_017390 [Elasticomyces elasticus]KAK5753860.1 hypothetical protein LTS12_016063 [Elasticomyces elasticus]
MADTAKPLSIYHSLDASNQEIRVLYLLPARNLDAPICVEINTVSLRDKPYYEALSYAWGDPNDTTEIWIRDAQTSSSKGSSHRESSAFATANDAPLESIKILVTKTLHGALRRLRWNCRTRVVWADALSINQANIAEKNEQVSIMGSIYQAAESVKIWLGEDQSPRTKRWRDLCLRDYGLDTYEEDGVNNVSPSIKRGWQAACIHEFEKDVDFVGQEHHRRDAAKGENSEMMTILAHALYDLLSRPWFTRLWVIQEVVLPKRADFLVGSSILPFRSVMTAKDRIFDNTMGIDELQWHEPTPPWLKSLKKITGLLAFLERISEIFIAQQEEQVTANHSGSKGYVTSDSESDSDFEPRVARWSKPAHVDLMVLGSCGGQDCRDAKDRVYALLSFTTLRSHIEVQYNKTVEEVYMDTAAALLRDNKHLSDVLYHASLHPSMENDFPSWIPDWRTVERPKRWPHVPEFYDASAVRESPHRIVDTSRLRVKAVWIDKIANYLPLPAEHAGAHWEHADVHWFHDMSKLAYKQSPAMQLKRWRDWLGAHHQSHETFWRVALQGVRVSGHRRLTREACAAWEKAFEQDDEGNFYADDALDMAEQLMFEIGGNHRPCTTDQGYVGVIGPRVDVGDDVYIIAGCRMPVVLRPISTLGPNHFRFIELCYIDGVMRGGAVVRAMRALDHKNVTVKGLV